MNIKLIAAPIAAMALFAIMKGPVYTAMQVQPNTQTAYTPALCAVGAVVSKGLSLSDETNQILEKVMPLEDWKNYYSRFEGHDRYMWGRGADQTFDARKLSLA